MRRLAIIALLVLPVLAGTFSCKTPGTAVRTQLRPMSAARLIRNIESHAFDYQEMAIRRINVQFENGSQKTSFRASLRAVNNEKIMVTLSKLNIPLGRVLLTSDSVRFVNYMERNYFIGDYDFLSDMLNMDISFETINAIISNNVFSFREEKNESDLRDYNTYIDEGMYVLQSFSERKLDKINRKGKERKIDRYLKKTDEEAFLIQTLYVDPEYFRVRRIILDDPLEERQLRIDFDKFTEFDNQLYPGDINLRFKSPDEDIRLNIELSRFSMENDQDFELSIPERYTPLK